MVEFASDCYRCRWILQAKEAPSHRQAAPEPYFLIGSLSWAFWNLSLAEDGRYCSNLSLATKCWAELEVKLSHWDHSICIREWLDWSYFSYSSESLLHGLSIARVFLSLCIFLLLGKWNLVDHSRIEILACRLKVEQLEGSSSRSFEYLSSGYLATLLQVDEGMRFLYSIP